MFKNQNMASFKFYLKDGKSKKATSIYLLFDDGVNRCKLYIQESISPKDWNCDKGEARKTLQGFSDFNLKIEKIKNKCKELHTSLTKDGVFTTETLKLRFKIFIDELNNRLKQNTTGANRTFLNLTDFADYFIESNKAIKTNTTKNRLQTLNLLKEFETQKRKKIRFEGVNIGLYNGFIDFMTEKNFNENTKGKHIKNLRHFLNGATKKRFNKNEDYKDEFTILKEDVVTIYLNEDELFTIFKHDFSGNKRLEQTRDLFLIGCYTGLRFSDFSQLTPENIHGNEITVTTQKTKQKVVVPIHPIVKEILNKYNQTAKGLPRAVSNQKMNKYLKEVGREAGIVEPILIEKTKGELKVNKTLQKCDLITTHTARRSFATNLYKSRFPAISIMKITGHTTEKSFLQYIKIGEEENAKDLQEHWSKLTKLKVA